MTEQPTYLVRLPWAGRAKTEVIQADNVRVKHPMKLRVKRIIGEAEGFPMREMENTGQRVKSLYEIAARGPESSASEQERHRQLGGVGPVHDEARRSDGSRAQKSWCQTTIEADAATVKKTIRRLRPQEADALNYADMAIEEARKQLADAKEQRRVLARVAWQKAHKVTLKEVEEAVQDEGVLR